MTEDQLVALRQRILVDFQVQRGSAVWAPWGKTGWSAMVIKRLFRKKVEGMRVKPRTEEEVAKGKVLKDRLIRRDPKLKGKDRPEFTPEEAFAHVPKPDPKPTPSTTPPKEDASVPKKLRKSVDETFFRETWISGCASRGMNRAEAEAEWSEASANDDW